MSLKEKSSQSTNQVPHWLGPGARKMNRVVFSLGFFPNSHKEHWTRLMMGSASTDGL